MADNQPGDRCHFFTRACSIAEENEGPEDQRKMPAHTVKVSIGLPVYNGQQFVACAIESILRQAFTDFQLVITDNASTDKTGSICRSFAERDRRIVYHRLPRNIGAILNFERVYMLCGAGEYFKWAAHDD